MIQIASVNAFEKVLKEVFANDVKLEWVVIPVSFYTPAPPDVDEEETYVRADICEKTHQVQSPLTITRKTLGMFEEFARMRAAQCSQAFPGHEMALGVTLLGGYTNTTFKHVNLQIFDGTPDLDLEDLPKAVQKHLDKFTILSTGNSYHFYMKENPADHLNYTVQQSVNRLIDQKWDAMRYENGGYIRLTANVKGAITEVTR